MTAPAVGPITIHPTTLENYLVSMARTVESSINRAIEALLTRQFVLAIRNLERICDHTTNIAEDVVFWLQGLDIRHGKANPSNFASFTAYPEDM